MKNKQQNILKDKHKSINKSYESMDNRPSENVYAESKAFLEDYIDRKTES